MRRSIGLFLVLLAMASAAGAQRSGTLISADPVASQVAGTNAWRIRYTTQDENRQPLEVTGMVVAPAAPSPRLRPVLAWTHGTWGIDKSCSPSLSPNFWLQTAGLDALAQGMVVVAPDYIGLGGSDVRHPFLSGIPTGQAVLDAVRAVQSLKGASAGKRFAVWGESQGGHAALWTAQVQPTYAPDLELVGVVAAAPPTDLQSNLRQAPNATVRTFFTAYIGQSWSDHYDIPLATIAGPGSRAIIGRLALKCISLNEKPNLGMTAGILILQSNMKNTDITAITPWSQLSVSNSPQVGRFTVPLLIAQNPTDQLVAPAVTRAYAQELCAAGQAVRWIDVNGSGHATTAKDSSPASVQWIVDRFAGRPSPNDCATLQR